MSIVSAQPRVATLGLHRVSHGDLMDGLAALFAGSPKAALFYSDPPWGAGNLKFWQTMNAKMNAGTASQEINYPAFLAQVMAMAAAFTDGPVLIEYGVRWKADVLAAAAVAGLTYHGTAHPTYNSGLPLDLHVFSTPGSRPLAALLDAAYFAALEGTHGFTTVTTAVAPLAQPGHILLDPCCGLGFSARAALAFGMRFFGNELNESRLAVTRSHLLKGTTP
jgi:hypothetical protein